MAGIEEAPRLPALDADDPRVPLEAGLNHLRSLLRGDQGTLAAAQRRSAEAIEGQLTRALAQINDLLARGPPTLETRSIDPREEDRPPPGGEPTCHRLTKPERRQKILVTEDDPETRGLIAELLTERFAVVQAGDGDEALQIVQTGAPDLILMDLFMPRLDGFAALEALRQDPRTADIPVIVLSAQGDDLTKVRGLNLGAVDYLVKPFSPLELMARVTKALEQKRQRDRFAALAQTDGLTDLPNFMAFRARLGQELRRTNRYQVPLTMVMIDMDDLKGINDRQGHSAGNEAIVTLADVIREALRGTDFAARYGGDEFVVLLSHTDADQGERFAERLRTSLGEIGRQQGLSLHISLGVAQFGGKIASADDLIAAADAALYQAKRLGRDRVAVSNSSDAPPSVDAT